MLPLLARFAHLVHLPMMIPILYQFAIDQQAILLSVGSVLLSAIIARYYRLRAKLRYSVGHAATLVVDQPLIDKDGKEISEHQIVRTASITLENAGLKPARASEITFNWKPMVMDISPARSYTEAFSPSGRYSLKFESLAPNERVTIEIIAINGELPLMTSVRSDECEGKMIKMAPQRVWPSWYLNILVGIFLLGLSTAVYLFASLLQLIAA